MNSESHCISSFAYVLLSLYNTVCVCVCVCVCVFSAALDVKKQKDLSGFYRHLLNQTVGEEAIPDSTADRLVTGSINKP